MSQSNQSHWILAYYHFTPIADPLQEVAAHQLFFDQRDVTCRIYISEEGINGQMCAVCADAQAYIDWMHTRPEFSQLRFKINPYHEHVFPRKTVKYRKQLVALDAKVDLSHSGDYLAPKEWKAMLENATDKSY